MNVWKVRHEGSPVTSPDLTFDQVMQGLLDARFHPEDEVKGPADRDWQKLEDHPAFAEAAADIEPPPEKHYDDESHIDMNALIDVSLVLLIFFVLTTSYASLQKIIEAAGAASSSRRGYKVIREGDVQETMVRVKATQSGDDTTIFVEDRKVELEDLVTVLREARRSGNRVSLLLEHDAKVPHGVIVTIQDDAKRAGMEKVHLLVPGP
jgi:biopolymer transport protein ExbD